MKCNVVSNIVNVLILLVVAAIFLIFAPRVDFSIHGIVLPIQQLKTVSASVEPDAVQIYSDEGAAPLLFTALAKIDLAQHFTGEPDSQQEHALLQRAKELTAQLGGNGYIIKSYGHTEGLSNLEMNMYELQVIAIYSSNAV